MRCYAECNVILATGHISLGILGINRNTSMAALRLLILILGGSSICCLTLQHRYRTPVPIPANAEVHFKTLNTIDGSYHFGYDTGLMRYQSFREEVRDPTGRIKGKFGFIDPRGLLRITEYTADKLGYRAKQTIHYLVKKEKNLPIIGPIPSSLSRKRLSQY
ncbi:uncharacterized protein LOC111874421 [Cryptotermes secundus]|uniref:uncharacterized protein LOC111874421 n=1 Tax=Cryptotermes secundus TaxID=105785 RepID=UPI001454C0E9|nr:uncharacterized protein LOC111874421 [Cryptotermes secundus]